MRSRVALFFVVGIFVALIACYVATGGTSFHLRAVRVRAVDALTERPVQGVVVAVKWTTSDLLCIEGECLRRPIRMAEAVTDASGVAQIPAADAARSGWEILGGSQPWVVVYKAGCATRRDSSGAYLIIQPISQSEATERAESKAMLLTSWAFPPAQFPRLAREVQQAAPAIRH